MTKEEIRHKAIECRKLRIDYCNLHQKEHWVEPCNACEYYEPYAECPTIFAYEHGFADGYEQCKKEHNEFFNFDAVVKIERKKVLKWIISTSHITCDEGEWYVYDTEAQEWHHTGVEELLELYDERMKEDEEND